MTSRDFLLAPIFIIVIYVLASIIKKQFIAKDDPAAQYFMKGLHLKIIGAFATALIYWYYYGDGDTIYYFRRIAYLNKIFARNISNGMAVFFYSGDINEAVGGYKTALLRLRYFDASYFKVVQIGTIASFFSMGTYIGIALIFSFLSYLGLWMLYRVFYGLYPRHYKLLAWSTLYVPSIVFWGSGLFKDTITMGCVGGVTYATYRIFISPKRRVLNIFVLIICAYVITAVKTYIIACLVPMLLLWVVLNKRSQIQSKFIRVSLTPILLAGTVVGGLVMTRMIAATSDRFSLDQMQQRAEEMVWWHQEVKEIYGEGGGGSSYTLGNPYDFSPLGILKKLPLAVNVTYFRPYPWEAGNPVMLLSSAESMAFFFFFVYLIATMGMGFFTRIFSDSFLMFCLGFSVLFAVGVGLTSYNFGALVRYKIPSMPFFLSMMFILYGDRKLRIKEKKEALLKEEKGEQETDEDPPISDESLALG